MFTSDNFEWFSFSLVFHSWNNLNVAEGSLGWESMKGRTLMVIHRIKAAIGSRGTMTAELPESTVKSRFETRLELITNTIQIRFRLQLFIYCHFQELWEKKKLGDGLKLAGKIRSRICFLLRGLTTAYLKAAQTQPDIREQLIRCITQWPMVEKTSLSGHWGILPRGQ